MILMNGADLLIEGGGADENMALLFMMRWFDSLMTFNHDLNRRLNTKWCATRLTIASPCVTWRTSTPSACTLETRSSLRRARRLRTRSITCCARRCVRCDSLCGSWVVMSFIMRLIMRSKGHNVIYNAFYDEIRDEILTERADGRGDPALESGRRRLTWSATWASLASAISSMRSTQSHRHPPHSRNTHRLS